MKRKVSFSRKKRRLHKIKKGGGSTKKRRFHKIMKGGALGPGYKRALEFTSDPKNNWDDRVKVGSNYFYNTSFDDCAKFWNFVPSSVIRDCAFYIWDNNKKKYLIKNDKIYNTIKSVHSADFFGVPNIFSDEEKGIIIKKTKKQYRTPELLRELFPDGFYMNDKFDRLISPSEIPDTEDFVDYGITEQNKIKVDKMNGPALLRSSRNPKNSWNYRKYAAKRVDLAEYLGKKFNEFAAFKDFKDIPCPEKFGTFDVTKWGKTGGCGFNIWEPSPEDPTKKKKYWIDIDPIFNVASVVKDESNAYFGVGAVDSPIKNEALNKLSKEFRTPDKTPNFFLLLFPNGYYSSETSTELIKVPEPLTQPDGQPATQSTVQYLKQLVGQPTKQPDGQPAKQPDGQSATQPVGQPAKQPVGQPAKQLVGQPATQSTVQYLKQLVGQPTKQPDVEGSSNSGDKLHEYVANPLLNILTKGTSNIAEAIKPKTGGKSKRNTRNTRNTRRTI